MQNDSFEDFLKETRYCDINSKEISDFAKKISGSNTIETIYNIFEFVRDSIVYRFDFTNVFASETLKKRKGNCFNKANLQVALLRKSGIPAGYGVYLVHKEILKPILPEDIFSLVNEPTVHVFAKLFIENRWICLDATVDMEIFEHFYRDMGYWEHKQWDRKTDIKLCNQFVVEDQGLYANIDLYLSQPPRFWTDELIKKANNFIEEKIRRG